MLKDYRVDVLSYVFSIGGKTLKAVVVTSCFSTIFVEGLALFDLYSPNLLLLLLIMDNF